jgi:DNA-binding NtrC family response regulator
MRPVILVVEDDLAIRLNIVEILLEAGFEVLEAPDTASALASMEDHPDIRLVYTNVRIPGELDGIALVLRLRALYPEVRVIIISAFAKDRARLPAVPFLPKPFSEKRLVDLAREALAPIQS